MGGPLLLSSQEPTTNLTESEKKTQRIANILLEQSIENLFVLAVMCLYYEDAKARRRQPKQIPAFNITGTDGKALDFRLRN